MSAVTDIFSGPDLESAQRAEQERLEAEALQAEEDERKRLREEQDRILRSSGRGARSGQGSRLSDTSSTLG